MIHGCFLAEPFAALEPCVPVMLLGHGCVYFCRASWCFHWVKSRAADDLQARYPARWSNSELSLRSINLPGSFGFVPAQKALMCELSEVGNPTSSQDTERVGLSSTTYAPTARQLIQLFAADKQRRHRIQNGASGILEQNISTKVVVQRAWLAHGQHMAKHATLPGPPLLMNWERADQLQPVESASTSCH